MFMYTGTLQTAKWIGVHPLLFESVCVRVYVLWYTFLWNQNDNKDFVVFVLEIYHCDFKKNIPNVPINVYNEEYVMYDLFF